MRQLSKGLDIYALTLVILFLAACDGSPQLTPEERLDQLQLEFPSVLGYVRVRPDIVGTLLALEGMLNLPELDKISPEASPRDYFLPFMDRICVLCKPNSHISIVFIDPKIFGGPMAIHFESDSPGKLATWIEEDARFERVPGSDPPEFAWKVEAGWVPRAAKMLKSLGIDAPGFGDPPFLRLVIDKTDRGTLVMPSFDLRWDFLRFLEETDNLSPWSDAALVMHLEPKRFAKAYAEVISQWISAFNGFLDKAEKMASPLGKHFPLTFKLDRLLPVALLEFLHAVDGIRFVSSAWDHQQPELCIQAADDSFLKKFFAGLREDKLDLAGLLPGGVAFQWNADPAVQAGLVKQGVEFLADNLDQEQAQIQEQLPRLIQSLARDEGRYLSGIGWTGEGFYLSSMSALYDDGTAQPQTKAQDLFCEAMLPIFLPNMEFSKKWVEGKNPIQRLEGRGADSHARAIPWLGIETGSTGRLRITNILLNVPEAELTQKLLRLARAGGGRVPGAPEKSVLFFRASFSMLGDILMPGIENLIPLTIMGYGAVEGNRLSIRFVR